MNIEKQTSVVVLPSPLVKAQSVEATAQVTDPEMTGSPKLLLQVPIDANQHWEKIDGCPEDIPALPSETAHGRPAIEETAGDNLGTPRVVKKRSMEEQSRSLELPKSGFVEGELPGSNGLASPMRRSVYPSSLSLTPELPERIRPLNPLDYRLPQTCRGYFGTRNNRVESRHIQVLPPNFSSPASWTEVKNAPADARFHERVELELSGNSLIAKKTFHRNDIIAVVNPEELCTGSNDDGCICTLASRVKRLFGAPGFPEWASTPASFVNAVGITVASDEGVVKGLYPFTYFLFHPPRATIRNVRLRFRNLQLLFVADTIIQNKATLGTLETNPITIKPQAPALTSARTAQRTDIAHFSPHSEVRQRSQRAAEKVEVAGAELTQPTDTTSLPSSEVHDPFGETVTEGETAPISEEVDILRQEARNLDELWETRSQSAPIAGSAATTCELVQIMCWSKLLETAEPVKRDNVDKLCQLLKSSLARLKADSNESVPQKCAGLLQLAKIAQLIRDWAKQADDRETEKEYCLTMKECLNHESWGQLPEEEDF
eukprot:Gregarina_sp_Poly_1__1171@NODE_1288_length_4492_cov_416_589831_g871_i0_p1_GENE_NODE_1288_length_4492_cov_416_589831_g871_i0NODE_1288_length_4492_cov_416_589831_g871_i0_p1_ORF_typecomplete_len546_score87_02SAP130_C/PF16014_5/0_2_NODE_1288_length_4492_cov_416_589831_g871_i023834020